MSFTYACPRAEPIPDVAEHYPMQSAMLSKARFWVDDFSHSKDGVDYEGTLCIWVPHGDSFSVAKLRASEMCLRSIFAVPPGWRVEIDEQEPPADVPTPPQPPAQTLSDAHAEYLATPEWQERAEERRRFAGYRCEVCYAKTTLNVHHRTYVRHGQEMLTDLVCLCRGCHTLFHRESKLAKH